VATNRRESEAKKNYSIKGPSKNIAVTSCCLNKILFDIKIIAEIKS